MGKKVFQFQAGEFFQNNPFILPRFVDYVVEQASETDLLHLIDAYCGVGLFALSAADRFQSVTGIEVSAAAIRLAESNAVLNRVENANFFTGVAEEIFARVSAPPHQSALIIDPPRRGCDEMFLRQLVAWGPRRVIYVSCDPSTQARDIRILESEGYRTLAVQPFDLFPQTRHIENVATLEKIAQ